VRSGLLAGLQESSDIDLVHITKVVDRFGQIQLNILRFELPRTDVLHFASVQLLRALRAHFR
jgi:hypothetical protein